MRILDLHKLPDDCPPYTYIGRRMAGRHPLNGSPLANPFKSTGKTAAHKAECIGAYRNWLSAKIQAGDPAVMQALQAVNDDTTLACWCIEVSGEECLAEPARCHAQVIFQAANLVKQGLMPVVELLRDIKAQPTLFDEAL